MKWIGIFFLALLGLILLVLICPVGVRVDASDGRLAVFARVFGVSFQVFPLKERKKKGEEPHDAPTEDDLELEKRLEVELRERQKAAPAAPAEPSAGPAEERPPEPTEPSKFPEIKTEKKTQKTKKPKAERPGFVEQLNFEVVCQLLSLAAGAVKGVLRCFYIPKFRLYATLHSDDAAQTALLYGGACSFMGAVMPKLERACRIKKTDVQLYPDFDGRMAFDLTVTIMTVPLRLVILGISLWIQWLKINKKMKAVQK